MFNPQPKNKTARLKGTPLRSEQIKALERTGAKYYNGFSCQNCGAWVNGLKPPHHKKYKSQGGSDCADNQKGLCDMCHSEDHNIKVIT